jgi:ubiquinone/menaquinone biosynthesis C-methylase UbiE
MTSETGDRLMAGSTGTGSGSASPRNASPGSASSGNNGARPGSKGLAAVRRAWSILGTADPLWAVCVDRDRRAGSWDVGEFMASGRAEAAAAMARLDQLGICQTRDAALDFGCGVGRVTAALGGYFGAVTGVDIAEPMLDRARSLLGGQPGCEFVGNDQPDLRAFADDSFDLVYCSLVLQHMPPALAAGYLREFVRVLRPGGGIVVVVPDAHRRTPKGLVYALAPQQLIGFVQRRLFGYPAGMRMHVLPVRRVRRIVEGAGARLVASDAELSVGPHWRGYRHVIAKG